MARSLVLLVTYSLVCTALEADEHYCNFTRESNNYHCTNDQLCPTWFRCNTTTNRCHCGKSHHGMIRCQDQLGIAAVSNCYCVTYDQETEVGSCYYNCENTAHKTMYDRVYHRLPLNSTTNLNTYMCGRFNRMGTLCGRCKEGHSPFVLSYNLSCVECPSGYKHWWRFILAGFVPLTFFYFFMVFFNINVTSSRLHGVVLFSQAVSMPALARLILLTFVTRPDLLMAAKILFPFYSFWNLDFFRSLIPDICLNVSTLEALALDYAVAVYPLLLIILSYVLIVLYDRDVGCILYMWKPFRKVFNVFKHNWDIRTSVIDSFATFFLLSYVKVLSISSDLLIFTHAYSLNGNISTRLYYDATLPYFGEKHLPYAVLAIVFLVLFVVIPTLILTLYPFQFFQKFLSCFPIQWHFLHAFVDSFQGCYKDGTEPGTFDCRWFALIGLFIRLASFAFYAATLTSMFFVYAIISCVLWLILLVNVHPFKKTVVYHQSTDSAFITLIIIFYISILGVNIGSMEGHAFLPIMNILTMLSPFMTITYILYIVIHWMYSQRRCGGQFVRRVKYWRQHLDYDMSQSNHRVVG